ncbi:hypothetical protein MN608_02878 [Microdochium nivale]|nr:hypothetical protein MN608_02878 [Microdochium nivale]
MVRRLTFVYNINYEALSVFIVTPGMRACSRWDCRGTSRAAADGNHDGQSSLYYPEGIPLLVLTLVLFGFTLLRTCNSNYVSTVPLLQERRTFSIFAMPFGVLQAFLQYGPIYEDSKVLILGRWQESALLSAIIHVAPSLIFYPHYLAANHSLAILNSRRAVLYRRHMFVLAALAISGLTLGFPETYLGLRWRMMYGFVVWPVLVR